VFDLSVAVCGQDRRTLKKAGVRRARVGLGEAGAGTFCAVDGLVFVKMVNAADAPIMPIFTRLRRDLRIPVVTFSKAMIFVLRTVSLDTLVFLY
jgi:hypothetical protein